MIPVESFAGERVAIFGMGRSGLASVRSLMAGNATVYAWDDGEAGREAARKAGARAQEPEAWPWETLKALVLAPGVPLTHPKPHAVVLAARKADVPIIGDVELFAHAMAAHRERTGAAARCVAITGTNGKSTTTALSAHLLQRCGFEPQMGGNIGRPLLDLDPPTDKTVYVLELSSFQIDLTHSLVLDAAVLLNVSADHLDRHGTIEAYAAVKGRIFSFLTEAGSAIIGVDDGFGQARCTALRGGHTGPVVPVSVGKSLGTGIYVIDGTLWDGTVSQCAQVKNLQGLKGLPGTHNWQNAAAAFALVRALGGDASMVDAAFETFPGLPHRIETVGSAKGVLFVNDSKATNAEAAAKALVCFDPIFWIAGGRAKSDGIDGLSPYFRRVRKAFLIGEAQDVFAETLEGRTTVALCGTLEAAVAAASEAAFAAVGERPGVQPVVLFSPAAASFDQFANFEVRGDVFRSLVADLVGADLVDAEPDEAEGPQPTSTPHRESA
ncbi:MAG: UDP-N-acetylmuramoyl-L-alanine--D-glutamate ligase [Pseudomonadota bacterium]